MTSLLLVASMFLSPVELDVILVRALGDDSFDVREVAHQRLRQRGWTVVRLMQKTMANPDPEVRHRAGNIILEVVSDRMAQFEPMPCIDSIWYDADKHNYAAETSRTFNGLCRRVFGRYYDTDLCCNIKGYRQATRNLVRDCMSAGWPDWVIRLGVNEMRRRDALFDENCAKHPGMFELIVPPTEIP